MSSIGFNPGNVSINQPVDTGAADAADSASSGTSLSSSFVQGAAALRDGAEAMSLRFGARGDGVAQLQDALGQLGFGSGGSDGIFGRGTESAVSQFQRSQGLAADGIVGPGTLAAIDAALAGGGAAPTGTTGGPAFTGGLSGAMLESTLNASLDGPGPEDMANAANALVEKHAQHYGVDDPWFNVDSNHALPANVRLGGLKGKWKCNLFAGNAMAAAGFEPPYYGNKGKGEYPNANQLYKWSDKHAGTFGNQNHVRFELKGELDVQSLSGQAREDAIKDLLAKAEPGDMIIVDHMGSDVADGGHCRVVVKNDIASGGTITNAQASFNEALARDEGVSAFTGEETIWILKPNKARADGAADV